MKPFMLQLRAEITTWFVCAIIKMKLSRATPVKQAAHTKCNVTFGGAFGINVSSHDVNLYF